MLLLLFSYTTSWSFAWNKPLWLGCTLLQQVLSHCRLFLAHVHTAEGPWHRSSRTCLLERRECLKSHITGSCSCRVFGRVFAQHARISRFNHQYNRKPSEQSGTLLLPQYPGGGSRSVSRKFEVVLSDVLSSRAAWATWRPVLRKCMLKLEDRSGMINSPVK